MILAPTVTDLWLSLVRAGHNTHELNALMELGDDGDWCFYFLDGYDGPKLGRVEKPFTNSDEVSVQCRALNAFREECDRLGVDPLTIDRTVFGTDDSGSDDYVARPYRGEFDE